MAKAPLPTGLFYILEEKKVRPAKNLDQVETLLRNKQNILAQNSVKGFLVSTAFLTVEHPGGSFFETMVFGKNKSLFLRRYKTYAQAEKGHKEIIAMVQSGEIK